MQQQVDEPRRGGATLQAGGLMVIAIAVLSLDRATPYPGSAAFVPVLGAAALLVGGQWAPDSVVSRLLASSPLRWLGRISYAWYLWHWPMVGIGEGIDPLITEWGRVAWSAAALLPAWLTYRYIEQSAASGRLSRIETRWLAPAALVTAIAMALVAHGAMRVAERTVAAPDQQVFAAAREDRMQHECWATTLEEVKGPCEFGDRRSSTTVVLFGDSHAEHWLGSLDRVGRERGWKIVAFVKGGCPVADMPEQMNARLKRHYHECTRYREAMVRRIVAMRPAAVILSSWDHYVPHDGRLTSWQVTPETWRAGLRRTFARVTAAGIPTAVIRGTPRTFFDVPSCLSRAAAGLPFARSCNYELDGAISVVARNAQTAAARELPVRFVDMNDQICSSQSCPVVRDGVVIFTDDNHLTASFSRSVTPILGERLVAALPVLGKQ